MAKVPPLTDRTLRKGEPPARTAIMDNLERPDPGAMQNLNFKVTTDFKRDFRIYAATHNLSLVKVLYKAFEVLRAQQG